MHPSLASIATHSLTHFQAYPLGHSPNNPPTQWLTCSIIALASVLKFTFIFHSSCNFLLYTSLMHGSRLLVDMLGSSQATQAPTQGNSSRGTTLDSSSHSSTAPTKGSNSLATLLHQVSGQVLDTGSPAALQMKHTPKSSWMGQDLLAASSP